MAGFSPFVATTTTENALPMNAFRWLSLAAVLTVLPLLLLYAYWHPLGTHEFDWFSNWGGKYNTMSWWQQQLDWYTHTMGRYTSTALQSTAAHWYSLGTARVVLLAVQLGLGFAIYGLVSVLGHSYSRGQRWGATAVILALWVSQLSNPFDTLYRYSGVLTYQLGLIGWLLMVQFVLKKQWKLAGILAFLTVGCNEISLLQTGIICGVGFFHGRVWRQNWAYWWWLAPAAVGAILALAAPGNFARAEIYAETDVQLLRSIGLTLASSLFVWGSWLGSTALLLLVLLSGGLVRSPKLELPGPRLLICVLMGWLPLSFAPVIFMTQGSSLPEGIVDLQIIPMSILLLVLVSKVNKVAIPKLGQQALVLFIGVSWLFAGLKIDRTPYQQAISAIDRIQLTAIGGQAWQQLLLGHANTYSASVEAQYQAFQLCAQDTCSLPPLEKAKISFLYDPLYDRRIRPEGEPYFWINIPNRQQPITRKQSAKSPPSTE
ncbi:MAG: hypothetical protein AAF828_09540 [Bacteroidota bacterium]